MIDVPSSLDYAVSVEINTHIRYKLVWNLKYLCVFAYKFLNVNVRVGYPACHILMSNDDGTRMAVTCQYS